MEKKKERISNIADWKSIRKNRENQRLVEKIIEIKSKNPVERRRNPVTNDSHQKKMERSRIRDENLVNNYVMIA